MGRYTNVQSYSDDSANMRTISYEQATGGSGRAAAASSASSQPPSRSDGEAADDDDDRMNNPVKSSSLKSDDDGGDQKQQSKPRSAISPSSCDTTSLFVGGLHPRIGDLHLQKLFSPYGEIVRINIVTHNPNESKVGAAHSKSAAPSKYRTALQHSKGYAFVEYRNLESARMAMSRLDGRQLMGKTLAVRPSRRKPGEGGQAGGGVGRGGRKPTPEEAAREYGVVQSKIEAVKRVIEQKKKGI